MNKKKKINSSPLIPINTNIDISADVSEPIDKLTDSTLDVIQPPMKKGSDIITNLLSFINETLDTALHIYKEKLEYYKQKCHAKMKKKIDEIPIDKLTTPDIGIIGETMENLKYNLDKDYLVDLYSNIIARDMDIRTKDKVHPSFVSILKDLNYDDLVFLEALYNFQNYNQRDSIPIIKLSIISSNEKMDKTFKTEQYFLSLDNYTINSETLGVIIENLIKLNLIATDFFYYYKDDTIYEEMRKSANTTYKPTFKDLEIAYKCECNIGIKAKGILFLTNLGQNLLDICLSK